MRRRSIIFGGIASVAALSTATDAAADSATGLAAYEDIQKVMALLVGSYTTYTSVLARERATDPIILAFAGHEIAEQAAIMRAYAADLAEIGLHEKHASVIERLEALAGSEFERAFVDAQIAGHKELLPIHQDYAKHGSDPVAKGASIVAIPFIQTHLTMLDAIQRQMTVANSIDQGGRDCLP